MTGRDAACSRANYTVHGARASNNDVLSCFLAGLPGRFKLNRPRRRPPADQRARSGIYDSPRFFFVPVLNYAVNPPNGFYPIVDFRAVSSPTRTPTPPTAASTASASNGLTGVAEPHHR